MIDDLFDGAIGGKEIGAGGSGPDHEKCGGKSEDRLEQKHRASSSARARSGSSRSRLASRSGGRGPAVNRFHRTLANNCLIYSMRSVIASILVKTQRAKMRLKRIDTFGCARRSS